MKFKKILVDMQILRIVVMITYCIMLNFLPKIRLGNLIKRYGDKNMHLFRHNFNAWSYFIISKCTYAALCKVVESMGAGG